MRFKVGQYVTMDGAIRVISRVDKVRYTISRINGTVNDLALLIAVVDDRCTLFWLQKGDKLMPKVTFTNKQCYVVEKVYISKDDIHVSIIMKDLLGKNIVSRKDMAISFLADNYDLI